MICYKCNESISGEHKTDIYIKAVSKCDRNLKLVDFL